MLNERALYRFPIGEDLSFFQPVQQRQQNKQFKASENEHWRRERADIERRTFFQQINNILVLASGVKPPRHVRIERRPKCESGDRATRARQVLEHKHLRGEVDEVTEVV